MHLKDFFVIDFSDSLYIPIFIIVNDIVTIFFTFNKEIAIE